MRVTNTRPIVLAPYVDYTADAFIVSLGSPNSATQWFQDRATVDVLSPSDGEPLNDGELTRAQDKIAVVRGPSTTASSTPNTRIESPSWSPDRQAPRVGRAQRHLDQHDRRRQRSVR